MTDVRVEPRITHIGICVTDLDRSIRFYTKGLGFVERHRMHVADEITPRLMGTTDLDVELVYLEHSGLRIELMHFHSPACTGDGTPRPMNLRGLTHFSIRVDDLDVLGRQMEAAGGRVLDDTLVTFAGGNRGIMVLDPDGTRLELIERVS